jgi:hypothetical protein
MGSAKDASRVLGDPANKQNKQRGLRAGCAMEAFPLTLVETATSNNTATLQKGDDKKIERSEYKEIK